jgi:hypothetical protein
MSFALFMFALGFFLGVVTGPALWWFVIRIFGSPWR